MDKKDLNYNEQRDWDQRDRSYHKQQDRDRRDHEQQDRNQVTVKDTSSYLLYSAHSA